MPLLFFVFIFFLQENDIHSLESGDEMYFPALQIGGERKKAVVCL
jgi:hypothetical protein